MATSVMEVAFSTTKRVSERVGSVYPAVTVFKYTCVYINRTLRQSGSDSIQGIQWYTAVYRYSSIQVYMSIQYTTVYNPPQLFHPLGVEGVAFILRSNSTARRSGTW